MIIDAAAPYGIPESATAGGIIVAVVVLAVYALWRIRRGDRP